MQQSVSLMIKAMCSAAPNLSLTPLPQTGHSFTSWGVFHVIGYTFIRYEPSLLLFTGGRFLLDWAVRGLRNGGEFPDDPTPLDPHGAAASIMCIL